MMLRLITQIDSSFITLMYFIFIYNENVAAGYLSKPPHNLSCYHCSSLTDGDSCRTLQLNDTETPMAQMACNPNQMFCSVILFKYSTDSSEPIFYSVQRRCEETCQAGCTTVGERIKLLLCRSCCNEFLCNHGNVAEKSAVSDDHYLFLITGMALYRYFSFFKSFETLFLD